jgi:hypothetical protein
MIVKCRNRVCGHVWDYQGDSQFYVTCPKCHNKLSIRNKNYVPDEGENIKFNKISIKKEEIKEWIEIYLEVKHSKLGKVIDECLEEIQNEK